jgi:hypothetical protein
LEQAKSDAMPGKVPIVWHRRNGKPSVIVVETAMLMQLAKEVLNGG